MEVGHGGKYEFLDSESRVRKIMMAKMALISWSPLLHLPCTGTEAQANRPKPTGPVKATDFIVLFFPSSEHVCTGLCAHTHACGDHKR